MSTTMVQYSPTRKEIYKVARDAVEVLQKMGHRSCLFGSAACGVYGLQRVPGDVDLVVWAEGWDAERIKNVLASRDDRFFRTPAPNYPGKHVLYMRISPQSTTHICKIDIITQREQNLPVPDLPDAVFSNPRLPGIPVMPLLPLLLLKLKGWSAHSRNISHLKYIVDARDINEILGHAVDIYPLHFEHFSKQKGFMGQAREWVKEYLKAYPESSEQWSWVGFRMRSVAPPDVLRTRLRFASSPTL
jgi:hypothetical protein